MTHDGGRSSRDDRSRLLTLSASSRTIGSNLTYHWRSRESASLWKNNLAWNFCAWWKMARWRLPGRWGSATVTRPTKWLSKQCERRGVRGRWAGRLLLGGG